MVWRREVVFRGEKLALKTGLGRRAYSIKLAKGMARAVFDEGMSHGRTKMHGFIADTSVDLLES